MRVEFLRALTRRRGGAAPRTRGGGPPRLSHHPGTCHRGGDVKSQGFSRGGRGTCSITEEVRLTHLPLGERTRPEGRKNVTRDEFECAQLGEEELALTSEGEVRRTQREPREGRARRGPGTGGKRTSLAEGEAALPKEGRFARCHDRGPPKEGKTWGGVSPPGSPLSK